MDAAALRRSGAGSPERPVAVLAGAADVGRDYEGASQRARQHYESLGATVVTVPDPRVDLDAAVTALHESIGMLVLPGGSPTSLADVLLGSTQDVGDRVLQLHDRGMALSGASAGAMVLAEYCVLPERSRRRTTVTHGLDLVEGVVLPHWQPGTVRWPLPDEIHLWGLPECGGVLIDDVGTVEAVGRGEPSFRLAGDDWLPVVRPVRLDDQGRVARVGE